MQFRGNTSHLSQVPLQFLVCQFLDLLVLAHLALDNDQFPHEVHQVVYLGQVHLHRFGRGFALGQLGHQGLGHRFRSYLAFLD